MKSEDALNTVTATLRGLTTLEWVLLVLAVLVVIGLAIAGFVWWRRRKHAAPAAPAAPVARPPVALGKLLVRDARAFWRGLPRPARRSRGGFHPVVVLGTEASGKAAIIERFSGVAQRRAELGACVEHTEGVLRSVLGTDAVVFDLSEAVVRAPREQVASGLTRALAPMLRRRAPVVVVCISPEALDKQSEQQLAELGSALRAKIDVLSMLRDEPCAVRVAISDVPGVARFDALFRLLQLPGVPTVLSIDGHDDDALGNALLGYTGALSTALTELTPRETLELVAFFEAVPQLASQLALILGELFAPADELTPRPDGLYLVPTNGGPNPLVIPDGLTRPAPSPILKHRLVALSLALACTATLLVSYQHHAERWDHASAAAMSYDLASPHELDLRLAIRAYTDGETGDLRDRLTPGFFTLGPRLVACSFVAQVRQERLIDVLASTLARPPGERHPEHALYAAALLYASRDDELGQLIDDRLEEWAGAVDLERSLLTDYLNLAEPYLDQHWIERLHEAVKARTVDGVEVRLERFLGLLAAGRTWTAPEVAEAVALARQLRPELRDLAQYGATQRILVTPPLDRLAPTFKVHAPRFELLAQLWTNRVVLDGLLQTVLEGATSTPTAQPRSFAELAVAAAPFVADGAPSQPTGLTMGGQTYSLDPGGFTRAVRGGDLAHIVSSFIERAPDDAEQLWFPDASKWREVGLPIQWPVGIAGADAHQRVFTRQVFDQEVKPAVLAAHALLDRLAVQPALYVELAELLDRALAAYASAYEEELLRMFQSFTVELASETAAQRILHTLAGVRSPMRELFQIIARDADLGLADDKTGYFDPLLALEDRFGALSAVFIAGKQGDAFVAYQDVLRDLATQLAAPAPAGKPGDPATAITGRLSPAGTMAFAATGNAPATPLAAVQAWLAANALPEELADAFRKPVRAVYGLGERDVASGVGAWYRELEVLAEADLFSRFPFDRRSTDDLDPAAVIAWLHPKQGRLAIEIMPMLTGLVVRTRGWDGRARHASACGGGAPCVRVPQPLLHMLDRLATAADLLFDEAGKPRPLAIEVTPRPFVVAGGPAPELVRLTVGDQSVFYFNQRPRRTTLALDWTQDVTAALSAQVKHDTHNTLTPPAIVVTGSPWSLLRLMQQAARRGATHTWRLRLGPSQTLDVSYDIVDGTAAAFGGAKAMVSRRTRGAR